MSGVWNLPNIEKNTEKLVVVFNKIETKNDNKNEESIPNVNKTLEQKYSEIYSECVFLYGIK